MSPTLNSLKKGWTPSIWVAGLMMEQRRNSFEQRSYLAQREYHDLEQLRRDRFKDSGPSLKWYSLREFSPPFSKSGKKLSTDKKRQDGRVEQCFDHDPLLARHVPKPVGALQFFEKQLDLPSQRIGRPKVFGRELVRRNIGYVQMIALRLRVPKADDPQLLPITTSAPRVASPSEAHIDGHVQDVALKPIHDVMHALTNDVDQLTSMDSIHSQYRGVGAELQPREKIAPVLVDAREEPVAEISKVEEEQVVLDPPSDAKYRTVVGALRSDANRLSPVSAYAHDDVRLERGFRVVSARRREARGEHIVQPHHRRIGQKDIAERGERPSQGASEPNARIQRVHRGGLQHRDQSRIEPIIEAALLDRFPGCLLISAPQVRERTLAAQAKTKHEGPEEIDDVDLPDTFDGSGRARQPDEKCGRKKLAQDVVNRYGCLRGHPVVSLGLDTRTDATRMTLFQANSTSWDCLTEHPCSGQAQAPLYSRPMNDKVERDSGELFSSADRATIEALREDPKARVSYELTKGMLIWSDELPRNLENGGLQTLIMLLSYRSMMYRPEYYQEREYTRTWFAACRVTWQKAHAEGLRWIGFASSRTDPANLTKLLELEADDL